MENAAQNLKTLLSADIKDELADLLITQAKNMVLDFCHIDELPERLCSLVLQTAVKLYNRMGQEGSSSYSEGGKSQSFEEIFSSSDKRLLYAYRRLE